MADGSPAIARYFPEEWSLELCTPAERAAADRALEGVDRTTIAGILFEHDADGSVRCRVYPKPAFLVPIDAEPAFGVELERREHPRVEVSGDEEEAL